jgi:hypothetical protein
VQSIGQIMGPNGNNEASMGDQFRSIARDLQTYVSTPRLGFEERGTEKQLTALYMAFAQARASFGAIEKSRTVTIPGKYSFDYAPMEVLLVATVKPLADNGLAVMMPFSSGDAGKVQQLLILAHKDGGRLVFTFEFARVADEKGFGGQLTYMQRYAYRSALSLAADGDLDDMPEAARGETQAVSQPRQAARPVQAPAQQQRPQQAAQAAPTQRPKPMSQPPAPATSELGQAHAQLVNDAAAAIRTLGFRTRGEAAAHVFDTLKIEPFPLGEPFLSALSNAQLESVLQSTIDKRAAGTR